MKSLRTRHFLAPLAFFLALLLTACGGSSSSSSPTLSGTAATGLAIANATITVVDATGISRTTTTDANGNYSLDVSGMTAPFLVKVANGAGVLYSVGNAAGIANIHPLTDLIVQTWYQVHGTTAAAAFAAPAANPPPTVDELKVITAVVVHVVQTWLVSSGLDPASFDIFSTPFTAGSGTGFDGFLDTLSVNTSNMAAPVVTVTSGTNVQTSNVSVSGSGTLSIQTQVTVNGTVTSTSLTTAFVPATAAASAALTGILTSLGNLATVVNTNSATLSGSNLTSFFDPNYLKGGLNATQGASALAADLQGATITAFVVDSILGFDSVNNVMTIVGRVTETANGVTATQATNDEGLGLSFHKQADGTWLFYGNQRHSKSHVSVNNVHRYTSSGCTGCSGDFQELQVQAMVLHSASLSTGTNSTVTGLFDGTSQAINLKNDNMTTENGITYDQWNADVAGNFFDQLSSAANIPPAGSQYAFALTYADNSTENYSLTLGGSTAEYINLAANIENTLGHSWSAVAGKSITIGWVLPTTYPIAKVEVYGYVSTASNGSCTVKLPAGELLNTTSTSAFITLPTTCNSAAVVNSPGYPSVDVVVTGINGEETDIWYAFDTP